MRFFNKAGVGLLLACAPLTGVGCASLSPNMSSIPLLASQRSAADQYRIALRAEHKQDYIAARDLYAALQQQLPNEAIYAHRMGVVCTELQEYATAEKYFEHARKLEPGNVTLLTDMGYAAIVQKDYARAEALLDAAVRLKPDDSRAINNLAMAVGFQGRFDESLTFFRKINSESQAQVNVAYIHTQRGERKQAIERYRRAVEHDPNNKLAADTLAKLISTSPATMAIAAAPPLQKELARPNKPESASKQIEEFEEPLVKKVAAGKPYPRVTAPRPRDRISEEQELPFFEDGEKVAKSIADAYAKAQAPLATSPVNDKPLIVPEERSVRPVSAKSIVTQASVNPSSQQIASSTKPVEEGLLLPEEEMVLPEEEVVTVAETDSQTRLAVDQRVAEEREAELREIEEREAAQRLVEERAAKLREIEEQAAQRIAEQRATEERIAKERAAEERAAKLQEIEEREAAQRLAEQRATEERIAKERAAEERAAKLQEIKEREAAQRLAEQRAIQERIAKERAAEERAAKLREIEEREAKQRLAEQRAIEERIAKEERAAEERAAKLQEIEEREAEQRLAEQQAAELSEVPATKLDSELDSLLNPPPSLILDEEEPVEQGLPLIGGEDNAPELKQPESDELTSLEWTKEQRAVLLAAGSYESEDEIMEVVDGLKGFCPVAIRDERRLVAALDQFACEHHGQTYRFYSAAALEKFQAQPELYAPIAGGLDIVAVRKGETVFNGTLDFAVWYRRRLHLFGNTENLAAFRAAPRSFGSVH